MSDDDIECIEAIWGYIVNVQLVEDKSQSIYGYFNLKTKNKTINVYFPEAFYQNEDVGSVEEFKTFIKKVNRMVTDNPEQVMVIAYGAIKKKRKMGLNINVISQREFTLMEKVIMIYLRCRRKEFEKFEVFCKNYNSLNSLSNNIRSSK